MIRKTFVAAPLILMTSLFFSIAQAEDGKYKPYILASQAAGEVAAAVEQTKQALSGAGFNIAGEYSPYADAHVIVITNDALKKAAAGSDFGGYGVAQRIGVTKVGEQVQVSYTNPSYMANMYRMSGNLDDVTSALENALGNTQAFGVEEAMTPKQLRKYHYMIAMPYFDDHLELAEYDDYQAAVTAVERGLANSKALEQVYRIDIEGKDEALFGVAVKEGDGADETVMSATDREALRHTAHLPYEVLVSDNKAYILHGKFRIAQSFPDLGMGTFMKISAAPTAIELTIKKAIK
jgi:hypothetical protein